MRLWGRKDEDGPMNIQSILATKGTHVVTIRPQHSIREAIATLVRHNIGALVVVNHADEPIGILSERDIVRAATTNEALFSMPVHTLMSREMITGVPEDDLEAVAHTMTEKRTRHVPVVDRGRLVGIVSIGDIVKAQRDRYQGELYTLQTQILADDASAFASMHLLL
jgi:CBS domain-containing protein